MSESASVEGLAQLHRELRQADADLSDLTEPNREAARIAAAAVRNATPRRSGRLAGSVRPEATATQALVVIGGPAVPYAGVVLGGWPARNIAPHPRIVSAGRDSEPRWLGVYRRHIDTVMTKIRSTP